MINLLGEMLRFIQDPANQFTYRTRQTLLICITPILLSMLIAIPIGILVARRPVGAFIASTLSGLGRAIPVLVLLVIMVPIIGIGFEPAVIALTLLGIPPILLNTIEGIRSIDPAVVDAARGMGMTTRQILGRIQIPLMLPGRGGRANRRGTDSRHLPTRRDHRRGRIWRVHPGWHQQPRRSH